MTLQQQADIIARALQTLQALREGDHIPEDDSVPALFAAQTRAELRELRDWFAAQGVIGQAA